MKEEETIEKEKETMKIDQGGQIKMIEGIKEGDQGQDLRYN